MKPIKKIIKNFENIAQLATNITGLLKGTDNKEYHKKMIPMFCQDITDNLNDINELKNGNELKKKT